MTIILAAMNSDYAVQVSDRRLSWNGDINEEERNKSFRLKLPGLRFTVAFTELACLGSFRTVNYLHSTIGAIGKTETHPMMPVRTAFEQRRPPVAVQGMLDQHARTMADDPRSAGTIGKQLDYILIFSDPDKISAGGRSTARTLSGMTMPALVSVGPGGQSGFIRTVTFDPVDPDSPPLAIPKVHRNSLCPCGSGKRYGYVTAD